MSITSKCNGCGATSLGGVLQHMPSCMAKKWEVHHRNVMPSTTITFDTPKDQQKFADNLKRGATGNTMYPAVPPLGADKEALRPQFTKLVTDMTVDKKLSEEFLIDELLAAVEAYVESLKERSYKQGWDDCFNEFTNPRMQVKSIEVEKREQSELKRHGLRERIAQLESFIKDWYGYPDGTILKPDPDDDMGLSLFAVLEARKSELAALDQDKPQGESEKR